LQTLKGASQVTPKVEWDFVLHSAHLYDRMGCDILALDLGAFSVFGNQHSQSTNSEHSAKLGIPSSSANSHELHDSTTY
jgi:hypothetical protein